jgi:hypothetical protein
VHVVRIALWRGMVWQGVEPDANRGNPPSAAPTTGANLPGLPSMPTRTRTVAVRVSWGTSGPAQSGPGRSERRRPGRWPTTPRGVVSARPSPISDLAQAACHLEHDLQFGMTDSRPLPRPMAGPGPLPRVERVLRRCLVRSGFRRPTHLRRWMRVFGYAAAVAESSGRYWSPWC